MPKLLKNPPIFQNILRKATGYFAVGLPSPRYAVATSASFRSAFLLITSLFFLWGFAHNLNPILIPHLKLACQLSDFESALIDSAFFLGYLLMALPAGAFMNRYGYKSGILLGLLLFAAGAFLFIPAADVRQFAMFLLALFIIASGLTFLETAANPYVTVLGDDQGATQRLNLAQSFNGLAATLAPLLGGRFILSEQPLTAEAMQVMTPAEVQDYLSAQAATVKLPYLFIGLVVLGVALLVWRTPLPEVARRDETAAEVNPLPWWRQGNLLRGIAAQFCYVGAQVCVSSFFIRFANKTAGLSEKNGAYFLSISLLAFMLGRFAGTYAMRWVAPARLLALYAVANVVLLLVAVTGSGYTAVYALIGAQFFMSILFPTIFSLSLQGMGGQTKLASSLLVMAIAGGAVFPPLMGRVSDLTSIQTAYLVPAVCFGAVLYFALRVKTTQPLRFELTH